MQSMVLNQHPLRALSPSDKASFSQFGLGDIVDPPFHCVHHAFEFQARRHPDSVAVEDFQHKMTYSELDRQANCLATYLREKGITPSTRVCLLVERSIFMIVGIIAVLKAGGAYVPLDGNVVSDNTLKYALKDSATSLILVQRKFIERVHGVPTICLEDSICDPPSVMHCLKPVDLSTATDSAYIIYTSGRSLNLSTWKTRLWILLGTTGIPKGVDVMHRNVTNRESAKHPYMSTTTHHCHTISTQSRMPYPWESGHVSRFPCFAAHEYIFRYGGLGMLSS